MKSSTLVSSLAEIAARSPFENLAPNSLYVVLADLRMGDGGKKDELAGARKGLLTILRRWYLPRGYTLVLNGDVEDLRGFWLKDILAAWPEMYALFDAFAEMGRLRKIVGDRDLALLRQGSYPYTLSHGLRLEGEGNSILVAHGHQASSPYAGSDYLSDYVQRFMSMGRKGRREGPDEDGTERVKAERRLCHACARLGILLIQGHTRRPLFESMTRRDAALAELERLLPEGPSGPLPEAPGLFSPGRVVGARGLRVLEIEGGRLSLAQWAKADRGRAGPLSPPPRSLEGTPYLRFETRAAAIDGIFGRLETQDQAAP